MHPPETAIPADSAKATAVRARPVRRSWKRWLVPLPILAGLAAGIAYERPRHSYPNSVRMAASQVEPGMTFAEVEAIFGKPPRDNTIADARRSIALPRLRPVLPDTPPMPACARWVDSEDDGHWKVIIYFDPMTEKVLAHDYCVLVETKPSPVGH